MVIEFGDHKMGVSAELFLGLANKKYDHPGCRNGESFVHV